MRLDSSDVPESSPSALLTSYPTTQAGSPPDVRSAQLVVRAGGAALGTDASPRPAAHSAIPGVDRATSAFTKLVASRELNVRVGLFAVSDPPQYGELDNQICSAHGQNLRETNYLLSDFDDRPAV